MGGHSNYSIATLIAAVVCLVQVYCDDLNPSDLLQPCGFPFDLACVRSYFSENSKCSEVKEVKEKATYDMVFPVFMPKFNLTGVKRKTEISQLDGEIETFYFDKKTKNLVMSVNFKGIFIDAPDMLFALNRKGKEPKIFKESVNATYPVILTAVLPVADTITLEAMKEAKYSAYFPNSNAIINVGPEIANTEDPDIKKSWEGIKADVPSALKEIFLTEASYFFLAYLQNYICDFGLRTVLRKEYDITVFSNFVPLDTEDEKTNKNPCPNNNVDCVIDFFKKNGNCPSVGKPDDKAVFRETYINYIPWNNATATWTKAELTGLDGKIESFYTNEKTGNLVMSVAFDSITMYTPELHLTVNERGQQPKIISDLVQHKYPVTLTAVIPMSKGLTAVALQTAYISAYFDKPCEFPIIGSKFTDSKDPEMIEIIKKVAASPLTICQETFTNEAYNFFLAYLQKHICDFGIPLTSYP